jgi:hypothetical protein
VSEPFRILSLDGGGIRGAATAQVLFELEQDLAVPLYDAFDLIAGTSTGGLSALYLAAERAEGEELVDLYGADNARRIMDKSFWDRRLPMQSEPKYDGTGKTEVLTEFFADKRIRDVTKPVLVTAYDLITRSVVVFKSYGGSDSAHNPTLREVANATSAAPTFFPTIETSDEPPRWLVDGGLAANNPSMCALAEALRDGNKLEDVRLLSIGTGVPIRGAEDPAAMGRDSQGWGGVEWLQHGLIDHLFAGNSTTCEYQCDVLLGVNHVRVNGPLTQASDDIDDVSNANIENLKRTGTQWYEQHEPAIRNLMRDSAND